MNAALNITIAPHKLPVLTARIDQLNRRAERLGVPLISYESTRRLTPLSGGNVKVELDVQITGRAPLVAGWTLICSIEVTPAGNMVHAFNGADVVEYRTAELRCDHCDMQRKRHEAYVFEKEGTRKMVGSTCVEQFLESTGVLDNLHLWREVEGLGEIDGLDDGSGGTAQGSLGVHTLLAYAAFAIRHLGFVPSAEDKSTRNYCMDYKFPKEKVEAVDRKMAEAAALWILDQAPSSDFMHNLQVAVSLGVVDKTAGLLVAGMNVYIRHLDETANAAVFIDEHLGAPKERLPLTVRVVRARYFETEYGGSTYLTMVDAEGHQIVWKASGIPYKHDEKANACMRHLARGDRITGKATVKEHSDYKGVKQTIVTRFTWEFL